MLGILFVYLVLGCFMDAIGMLLLTLPVFFTAVMKLGYDPIWFGIIVVKMCGVCLITPPIESLLTGESETVTWLPDKLMN